MEIIVGIDVSKRTLDVFMSGREKRFANTQSGFSQLVKWTRGAGVFVMEATGSHHLAVADHLHSEGFRVSVVNPQRASYYARAMGLVNKTDRADARVLALYAERNEVPTYQPESRAARRLKKLVRHRMRLTAAQSEIKVLLKEPALDEFEKRQLRDQARFLTKQMERLEREIYKVVASEELLAANFALLLSIPGWGPVTAYTFLSEAGDPSRFRNAKCIASYAGVPPRMKQSGTSIYWKPRMSKSGCAFLRRALYMCALAGTRSPGPCKAFFERLLAKGKSRMSALGAVMHKQIRLAYGVCIHKEPFSLNRSALTTA